MTLPIFSLHLPHCSFPQVPNVVSVGNAVKSTRRYRSFPLWIVWYWIVVLIRSVAVQLHWYKRILSLQKCGENSTKATHREKFLPARHSDLPRKFRGYFCHHRDGRKYSPKGWITLWRPNIRGKVLFLRNFSDNLGEFRFDQYMLLRCFFRISMWWAAELCTRFTNASRVRPVVRTCDMSGCKSSYSFMI